MPRSVHAMRMPCRMPSPMPITMLQRAMRAPCTRVRACGRGGGVVPHARPTFYIYHHARHMHMHMPRPWPCAYPCPCAAPCWLESVKKRGSHASSPVDISM